MKKKLLFILALIIAVMALTGCDDDTMAKVKTDIRARASKNTDLIAHMYTAGLIDKATSDELQKGVADASQEAINKLSGGATNLNPYISWSLSGSLLAQGTGISGEQPNPQPIQLVGQKYKNSLAKTIDYTVYELSGDVDINEITDIITRAKDANREGDQAKLREALDQLGIPNKYFKKKGMLLSDSDRENLIKDTTLDKSDAEDDLGIDFKIRDKENKTMGAVRLNEFNEAIVDKLINLDGLSVDTYLIDKQNKKIYNLVYPVYAINEVKIEPNNTDKFLTTYSNNSIYYINIYNNTISSDKLGADKLNQGNESLIKISSDTAGVVQSSFIMQESKLILRDYLECIYLPGVVDGEKWVALGRRVRVDKFKGNRSEPYASILNRKGEAVADSKLYVSDLLSIESDLDALPDYKGKAVKLGISGSTTSGSIDIESTENEDSGSAEGIGSVNNLLEKFQDTITPTLKFGCPTIATSDTNAGENGKMYLKGMLLSTNPFITGLYKSWIDGEDTEFGNLVWWNSWLLGANFKYTIDDNKLTQALTSNYTFEMREQGYIIIDKAAVMYIQDKYNKDDKENSVSAVRTAFIVLGIILMAYGLLLIASWTFDVNLISGPRLMGLLTFGKWEAIQDSSELPNMIVGEKSFMTFANTLKSGMMIMAAGFLLTIIDIVQVVLTLINVFGTFADLISQMIFGTK